MNQSTVLIVGYNNELDIVNNMQEVVATAFNDLIVGDNNNNVFFGLSGDDYFIPSRGSKFLKHNH